MARRPERLTPFKLRLREVRQKQGYKTLRMLSEKVNIPIAPLCQYENGKQCPSLQILVHIAVQIRVGLDDLIEVERPL